MSEIRVKENESLESALRRFKRSCAKEGVIAEVKKREHYVSPSLKRKQKSKLPVRTRESSTNIPLESCMCRPGRSSSGAVFPQKRPSPGGFPQKKTLSWERVARRSRDGCGAACGNSYEAAFG